MRTRQISRQHDCCGPVLAKQSRLPRGYPTHVDLLSPAAKSTRRASSSSRSCASWRATRCDCHAAHPSGLVLRSAECILLGAFASPWGGCVVRVVGAGGTAAQAVLVHGCGQRVGIGVAPLCTGRITDLTSFCDVWHHELSYSLSKRTQQTVTVDHTRLARPETPFTPLRFTAHAFYSCRRGHIRAICQISLSLSLSLLSDIRAYGPQHSRARASQRADCCWQVVAACRARRRRGRIFFICPSLA